MLTKRQVKLITSLGLKKNRAEQKLFIVEGIKGIKEFLKSKFILHHLFTVYNEFNVLPEKHTLITEAELKKISALKSPNVGLALFEIPEAQTIEQNSLIVALDAIRDPGNLGTIIRLCDWFGVRDLVCNKTTVDCYNAKVVQATMGSLTRVNINYVDLEEFLTQTQLPKFGTFLEGSNIYSQSLPNKGILLLGNEANGINSTLETLIDTKLTIPQFGNLKATESLNVATATAIMLSEFKRYY